MTEERELEGWKNEWQALGGRDSLATELAARVERDARRIRRAVAVEIAASVFAVSVTVWGVVRTRGDVRVAVACAAILVFTGVWISQLTALRLPSLRQHGTGLDAFVELTRRRLTDELRWVSFADRAMLVLGVLLVPWSVWMFFSHAARYAAEPWRAFVGFGTAALVFVLAWVKSRRRRRAVTAERDRFESIVAERTLA